MAKTALDLTQEEIADYRAADRQRKIRSEQVQQQRLERARVVAHQAAALLKTQFGASRVVLFGSVARERLFHRDSDIDLAVEGIENRDFWRAWSALDRVAGKFEIDLVDIETASPRLLAILDQKGVEL